VALRRNITGASTLDKYKKTIEKDPALERRFQQARLAGCKALYFLEEAWTLVSPACVRASRQWGYSCKWV